MDFLSFFQRRGIESLQTRSIGRQRKRELRISVSASISFRRKMRGKRVEKKREEEKRECYEEKRRGSRLRSFNLTIRHGEGKLQKARIISRAGKKNEGGKGEKKKGGRIPSRPARRFHLSPFRCRGEGKGRQGSLTACLENEKREKGEKRLGIGRRLLLLHS